MITINVDFNKEEPLDGNTCKCSGAYIELSELPRITEFNLDTQYPEYELEYY